VVVAEGEGEAGSPLSRELDVEPKAVA